MMSSFPWPRTSSLSRSTAVITPQEKVLDSGDSRKTPRKNRKRQQQQKQFLEIDGSDELEISEVLGVGGAHGMDDHIKEGTGIEALRLYVVVEGCEVAIQLVQISPRLSSVSRMWSQKSVSSVSSFHYWTGCFFFL
ncbi:hypothetical protein ACFX15_040332 [Malus domestica]